MVGDDVQFLLLPGWSHIWSAGSSEQSQQVSETTLPIFLSAEGCQSYGGARTSLQAQGMILNCEVTISGFPYLGRSLSCPVDSTSSRLLKASRRSLQ